MQWNTKSAPSSSTLGPPSTQATTSPVPPVPFQLGSLQFILIVISLLDVKLPDGKWYIFNDSTVEEVKSKFDHEKLKEVYLVFYERLPTQNQPQ